MKEYTVVLLRPSYLSDESGPDTYVAKVSAETRYDAIKVAQAEVFDADRKDQLYPREASEYGLCAVFEGHHENLLWSWQL